MPCCRCRGAALAACRRAAGDACVRCSGGRSLLCAQCSKLPAATRPHLTTPTAAPHTPTPAPHNPPARSQLLESRYEVERNWKSAGCKTEVKAKLENMTKMISGGCTGHAHVLRR